MIVQNKKLVITGGTGSLGQILVRRLLSGDQGMPQKIIVFSRDEGKQHAMRLSYLNKKVATDEVIYKNFMNILEFHIGDVCNYYDVCRVIQDADIVINAAALKQVPTCEYFIEQAILTNCMGAINIVRAIATHHFPVETVVGVSTDKACKPVNVMGMTKALQERIFIAANIRPKMDTRFLCVRYGNVLASRGSVVPLFHEQINQGGPVTITDSNMTRFLLSIDEAVDVIFAALRQGNRGEIFVPSVPSVKITNVGLALIGDKYIALQVIGARPGEKCHEILISQEEIDYTTKRGPYYVIHSMLPELQQDLKGLYDPLTSELSSEDNVLNYEETVQLLAKHRLLLEHVVQSRRSDLLR